LPAKRLFTEETFYPKNVRSRGDLPKILEDSEYREVRGRFGGNRGELGGDVGDLEWAITGDVGWKMQRDL
jgi:hypothetical protein